MRTGAKAVFFAVLLVAPAAAATSVEAVIARHGFAPHAVALVVEEMTSGHRLVMHRSDELAPPASTLKLVTAWAALEAFGPEHRFATRLWHGGTVDGAGVLEGDLVLEGGGDPLLDIDGLMTLAWALRAAGVDRVSGRFLLDDDSIPGLPLINPDQPVEAGYNAGLGALSLAFNRVERRPAPGGGTFTVPALRERGPAWPLLPFDRPVSVPVRDVGLHTARVFRDLALALDIELPAPERAEPPTTRLLVGDVRSPPLREIVQAMLLYSNNQVAEIVGLMTTGAPSLSASATVLTERLRAARPATDWRGFVMSNHSGLDPAARATPDQLLAILELAEARHGIIALLPAAGWSGSLRRRLRSPDAALRVWAKTGSLDFASALVGYVLPPDDSPRRIALSITDDAGRRARDRIEVPGPAMRRSIDDFTTRARDLRDDLVRLALTLEN